MDLGSFSFRVVWCTTCISFLFLWTVCSDPIKIDFSNCRPAVYATSPDPSSPTEVISCCPPQPTGPIIDGVPPPSTDYIRVRQASQCTDSDYDKKIKKAYELMRALPDDDPRSFKQQWQLHCSYCGGSFLTFNSSGGAQGVDIHFSWLFYPWHRYYLFFHERILQTLLGDPTFSLNYWNWDSPYTTGDGSSEDGFCLKQGDNFPKAIFGDPSASTYDVNRSEYAKGNLGLRFPDLNFSPLLPAAQQPIQNATEEQLIQSNLNAMYIAMVSAGTTAETFMGRPYRAGENAGNPSATGGAGSLEFGPHAGVHFWIGRDPPQNVDMGVLAYSSRDPVFFAHHSNIDRLWTVWRDIGPILGQNRSYFSDPDFLDTEFLFYDENKDLRRVKVADALDTTKLGYVYQQSIIDSWLNFPANSCSALNYSELIAQAESLPVPTKDSSGYYDLQGGCNFVLVIDRPDNPHGLEEFVTIDKIKLDRSVNAGFDVFVDLLDPTSNTTTYACAEYIGRFVNMANGQQVHGHSSFEWKRSVTRTLIAIQAPDAPSKLVITIKPLSDIGGYETIKFKHVKVTTSST